MKRKCKGVDIADLEFIHQAVEDCLRHKRLTRPDVAALMKTYGDKLSIAKMIQQDILSRHLDLGPVRYSYRTEPSSQKERKIIIQGIKQQLYDYVAVHGLEELLSTIGHYQCSAIKHRGQRYCLLALEKAVKENNYFYKGDVKKYFQSIDHNRLMDYLRKRVCNEPLLWLVETLIRSNPEGLAIGSYLSQHLANLYMSILYHELYENCYITRRRRGETVRENCCNYVIMYMDDFVIFTNNNRHLRNIDEKVRTTLHNMGLELKEGHIEADVRKTPVDMVGFRVWKDHTTIRKRNYIRSLRAFHRFEKKPMSEKLARRVISYWGSFLYSDSFSVIKRHKLRQILKRARRVIRDYDYLRRTAI